MKKQLLLSMFLAAAVGAQATEVTLGGEVLTVDTLFHAKVGPGTTQTSLRLTGANSLNIFYLTVDRSQAPGIKFRTVCGNKLAGNMTVRNMATSHSNEATSYFCGVNGDFYATSGSSSNGTSKVGTPTGACIVDGEVYKSSNSNYQFSVDTEGIARISRLNFYNGTAKSGESSVPFHGINVNAPNNSLTLYTPRYYGTIDQASYAGACAEITVKLVEGEKFEAGKVFKVEVTGTPGTTGDIAIPDDGFVLFGRSSTSQPGVVDPISFIKGLKVGDIVEIDNSIYTAEGEKITPLQAVSGNPKNVGGGVNLNSEGERGDASDRHPRTGIGVSEDGNTIVMMVIDGRTIQSAGVTTGMLGDMLIYAGCHEGVNLDGGGSSTLYTAALGVRNYCSDNKERAVGNGIFATVDGDVADQTVAEIAFADWRLDAPGLGIYTPVIYAFNAAGIMISDDYKEYTLSCPEAIGTISEDGKSLYTSVEGKGVLTASVGNIKATLPAYIVKDCVAKSRLERVIVDGIKPYTAEIRATFNAKEFEVDPTSFDWESADTQIATVNSDGEVMGVSDGETTITGRRGNTEISYVAVVQKPTGHIVPVADNVDYWTLKKSAVSKAEMAMAEDGSITINYTMSSTLRNPSITLQANKELWSRPDAIKVELDYDKKPSSVEILLRDATTNQLTTVSASEVGETSTTWIYSLSDLCNVNDLASFPIFLSSVRIAPSEAKNESGRVTFKSISLVYDGIESGVESITVADAVADTNARWYRVDGMEVSADALTPGLYIRRSSNTAEKVFVK